MPSLDTYEPPPQLTSSLVAWTFRRMGIGGLVASRADALSALAWLVDAGIDEWMRAIISAAKESLPNIGYRTQGTGYVIELK